MECIYAHSILLSFCQRIFEINVNGNIFPGAAWCEGGGGRRKGVGEGGGRKGGGGGGGLPPDLAEVPPPPNSAKIRFFPYPVRALNNIPGRTCRHRQFWRHCTHPTIWRPNPELPITWCNGPITVRLCITIERPGGGHN